MDTLMVSSMLKQTQKQIYSWY